MAPLCLPLLMSVMGRSEKDQGEFAQNNGLDQKRATEGASFSPRIGRLLELALVWSPREHVELVRRSRERPAAGAEAPAGRVQERK